MTRAEILSEIKRAEEEAKQLVIQANETRNKKILEAKTQSRDILKKAEEEALQYYMAEINKAREVIRIEKDKIISKGFEDSENMKKKSRMNIPKATKFILIEFERGANA